VLEAAAAATPSLGQAIGNVMGKLFRGERVSRDELGQAFVDGVSMFAGVPADQYVRDGIESRVPAGTPRKVVDWAYEQLKAREARARANEHANGKPKGPDPRIALGWKAGQKVTAADVVARRRELTKKHHPDKKGGSVEKMQAINAAADQLLTELGG
jgi:hypothetical protein